MKDRMTLGRAGDVRDLTADIAADPYATERVFAALDWEREEKGRKGLINNAIRRLAKKDRPFARSVLRGRRWEEMGISKQAFYCKLKKVCDLLEMPVNRGRKRHLDIGGESVSG